MQPGAFHPVVDLLPRMVTDVATDLTRDFVQRAWDQLRIRTGGSESQPVARMPQANGDESSSAFEPVAAGNRHGPGAGSLQAPGQRRSKTCTGGSESPPVVRVPQADGDESNDRVGRELNIADTSVDPETKMLASGDDTLIAQIACDEEVRTRRETNRRVPTGTDNAGLYVSPRGHLVLQDLCQRRANGYRKSAPARPRIASGTSTGSDFRGESRRLAGRALSVGSSSVAQATMIPMSDNDTLIPKIEPGAKTVTTALQ